MFRFILPLALLLLTPIAVEAQSAAPKPPPAGTTAAAPAPAALTLKERLGAKWKDEQRVNNCHVPPEKRGTKPRPDACAKHQSH
jgi:hypothetical protein